MGQCTRRWANRCANGEGKRCRCQCGGEQHGRSNPRSAIHEERKRKRRQFDILDELMQQVMLDVPTPEPETPE